MGRVWLKSMHGYVIQHVEHALHVVCASMVSFRRASETENNNHDAEAVAYV